MELSLRTTLPAKVEGDSAVVVPGKLLVDLARLLPADEVTIAYRPEDGVAQISSGSYTSKLNVFSAEDFPRLPSVDRRAAHDRDGVAARDGRPGRPLGVEGRVAPGADGHPGALRGHAAPDGRHRLVPALVQGDAARAGRPGPRGDHPGARARRSSQRIAAGTETVALGVNENTVVFGTGDTWLTTRRIDGQFPDVGRLLPESFEVEVDLPRAELRDVVRRAGVMALRNAPLRLRFAEGELTISAQSQDVGETHGVASGRPTRASRSRSASTPSSSPTASTRFAATRSG